MKDKKKSMKVYLVGGAVRDKLLHRTVKEKDFVVVGAAPEEMITLGYKPVGKDFPVFLHPNTKEEYALARTERKTGHGYKGFQCYAAPDVTLEQDLLRRDLTINALAEDEKGNVLDYYGGCEDLKNKVLRHVSPAFSEDPLRVLRVARFAARYYPLGFTIHPSTLQLMKDMVKSGEVNYLVPDRVWKELEKVLEEENPSVFFKVLEQCGALDILFPALAHLSSEHYNKSLEALDCAAKQKTTVDIRYALLCYFLSVEENNKLSLNKTGYPVPKDYSALAILLNQYHHKAASLKNTSHEEMLLLLENIDAFRREERFLKFLMACDIIHGKNFSKELLLKTFDVAKAVPIKPLLAQGLVGEDIAKALHEKRLEAIKAQ